MRKLFFGVFLVLFISCVEDVNEFIPYEASGPITQLQSLIASSSINQKLSNLESQHVISDNKSVISIDSDLLSNSSLSSYELNFIELNTYQDYILHNVEHYSNRGAINSLYSFYISLESNGQVLNLAAGKYIDIKIPYDDQASTVIVGEGSFDSGNLVWDYNDVGLNNNMIYGEWLTTDSDGSYHTEYGYIIRVNKSGWYNLVSLTEGNYNYTSACVNIPEDFTSTNTNIFLISQESQYISSIDMIDKEEGNQCSEDLPYNEDSEYTLISISELDGKFYFYKSDLAFGENIHYINPLVISTSDLKIELAKI